MNREETLAKALAFQDLFEKSSVGISHHSQTFAQAAADAEDVEVKDPSVIASDVAAQIVSFARHLSIIFSHSTS